MQDSVAELGAAVMQQADVAALWLLEALVLTLPQSLLQAYVVVSTDVGIMSPGKLISKSVIDPLIGMTLVSNDLLVFNTQWHIAAACACCPFPGPWCCTAEPAA